VRIEENTFLVADSGIRVMTIAPGIFDTRMVAGLPEEGRDSLGRQVPFPPRHGRSTTAAKNPCPDALEAETLYHAPAENPRPSRNEISRRVHLESSSLSALSSGGTLPRFSGLTTRSRMALMLPSATSRVTTLWGLPSPK
jgi:NAD(P)-dependent dehydrogenase (short-subunit alcohol dehydrogenase family)